MQPVTIGNITIGQQQPLAFMCGPCVIEGEDACLQAAHFLQRLFASKGIPLIFKASYDKANRSSSLSHRGPGLEEGLRILARVKAETGLAVVTDVHSPEEARAAAEVCDLLQIPAFLCRQTDLIVAAAETGAAVSVKKGQFMAPWDMGNVVAKIRAAGNERIILIERGCSFGYNNLVVDMRSFPVMQGFGVPVCFDATHAVQLPGALGNQSGGECHHVPLLARAAVAAGVQCLFLETHPDPVNAKSDAATMLPFEVLPALLDQLVQLHAIVSQNACACTI
jgi:2-dehydro-3-deoxyphosphooctonate aldolase (KDO 8-P synthase)